MIELESVSTHPVMVKAVVQSLKEIFNEGFYADKVLERAFKQNKKWGARDRRFLAETVYNMTRWWSLLLFYAGEPTRLTDETLLTLWAIYEAWFQKKEATSFIAKNFQLEISRDEIARQLKKTPSAPWVPVAFPLWLYERFKRTYHQETVPLLKSLNAPAPISLRANTLKTTPEKLQALLKAEGVETLRSDLAEDGVILKERSNVFITKAFREGFFEMQDEASQKIALQLNPQPGERIADVCAGAGGKTLHLAALMKSKGTLLACDVSEKKLQQLKIRARRAGVSNLRIQLIEGTKSLKRMYATFDGVLLDAPCSGVGVIRRNPDTKWKLSEEELKRLIALQKEILTNYSRLVKPGGRLLYATCSLLIEENEERIKEFLDAHPDFSPGGPPFKSRPDKENCDGFFSQLLLRK